MLKQVIVMRTDLGMRKGKMIAQGAHAAMLFLLNSLSGPDYRGSNYLTDDEIRWAFGVSTSETALMEAGWEYGLMAKIVVGIDSEAALLWIYQKALEAGLTAHLVTDAGKTEFGGIPTKTCCAIGPGQAD